MTDNDIIKAFEALAESKVGYIYQDVIDLLKRQKAEREALIAGQETLQKCNAEQKAEIERLERMADTLISHSPATSLARKQAIKEFAERLKQAELFASIRLPSAKNSVNNYIVLSDEIDNLVKEMVEEKQNG